MARYTDLFLAESSEHLSGADRALGVFADSPGEAEAFHAVFRHLHSLKGMAATMGYTGMVALAHAMEDVLDRTRSAGPETDVASRCSLLWEALACVGRMIEAVRRGEDPKDGQADTLVARLRETPGPATEPALATTVREVADRPDETEQQAPAGVPQRWQVEVALPEESSRYAGRAVDVVRKLGRLGEVRQATPHLRGPRTARSHNRLLLTLESSLDRQEIEEEIRAIEGLGAFTLRKTASPRRKAEKRDPTRYVRVRADLLDSVMELAMELALSQEHLAGQLPHCGEPSALRQMNRCRVLMKELYGDLMELRLVPFESVVHRLTVGVRDLARRLGKNVRFDVEGREVRLDRGILEALVDPLLHVIRNAIDHGIEDLETRIDRGKNGPGRVLLRLSRRNDRVRIVVEDDGRGMDPVKLRSTAVAGGFLGPEEAERLGDRETFLLTTLPGFSTAEPGGQVSGRGVGMDVVRDAVERLGGNVVLDSPPGGGTRVLLDLPQTLAVIEALLVRSGGDLYALPSHAVLKTLDLPAAARPGPGGERELADGDRRIRLRRLEDHLGCPAPPDHSPGPHAAALLTTHGDSHAMVVDELVGTKEILVRPLEPPLRALSAFTGASLLEDGSIALVLDPEALGAGESDRTRGASR